MPHIGGLGALLLVAIVSWFVYVRFFNGLYRVPGPFIASFTSLWKFYVVWSEKMPWTNTALHEKYGPLVRIGPRHISASSPEALSVIHVQQKGFQKTGMYNLLQPQLDGFPLHNVFSTQDQDYHTRLKRSIGNLYTMSAMVNMEHNIDRSIEKFLGKLKGCTKAKFAVVNMSAWLQYFAFDCIGEINFSQPMGFMDSGKDVDDICQLDHEMMMYFALWGQVPSLERMIAKCKTWTRAMRPNPLYNFTLGLVKERLNDENTGHRDMLSLFVGVHKRNPEKLSLREVTGAAYINIVTAHDVLAISLRAMLYHLFRNPEAYVKLVNEIKNADKANRLSHPVKYSEVVGLQYLNAVVNEALRIHPSTGTILERYVPQGGAVLHGVPIPEGTVIGVNAWVMNRNKSVFGDDVEYFRPERWIDCSPEQKSTMKKNLLTWGAGARSCIGKNMATMQILKVITELYRNFDIVLARPGEEWSVSGAWLTRQTQMNMKLTERTLSTLEEDGF